MEAFKNEVMARERCGIQENSVAKQPHDERIASTSTLFAASKDNKDKEKKEKRRNVRHKDRPIECLFCKGSHWGSNCTEVTDIESRKSILRKQNRCFICLKRSHIAKDCRSGWNCRRCRKSHHVSICSNNDTTISNEAESANESSQLVVNTSNCVLIQTALAKVFNHVVKKDVKVRLLFDNGSQRTF